MIVRCPECSTGFKLPDDRVSEKGVKLRCSKCSHVFRIRSSGDGETEIFYNDGDRAQNAAQSNGNGAEESTEDNEWSESESTQLGRPMAAPQESSDDEEEPVDENEGNTTQFGMPSKTDSSSDGSNGVKKRSKSASSNYNPFPHANLDVKPKKESVLSAAAGADETEDAEESTEAAQPEAEQQDNLDWGNEATRIENDPFEGAFEDEAAEGSEDAFEEEEAASSAAPEQAAPAAQPAAAAQATAQAPQAAQAPLAAQTPGPAAAAQASAAVAEAGAQPATEDPQPAAGPANEEDSDFWAQQNSSYRPEEMVDPSFGQNGPAFDPDQGVVDNQPAAPASPSQPSPSQPNQAAANPAPANSAPTPAAPAATTSPTASAQPSKPAAQSTRTANSASPSVQNDGGWEVDMVEDPIAPHTVGGSGLQKFANFMLIALIVGGLFVGVLAGLSGGFIDFKRFPHMLEVAFEGKDFEPREAWATSTAPVAAPAPKDPVRFEGVFATPVEIEESDKVILVRGKVQNVAQTDYSDVVVRGILYDKNERVIAQTKAPIGARVLQSQITEQGSADKAMSLLPQSAALLSSQTTEPFSLIFTGVPKKVFEAPDVSYRVEIAQKTPQGGQAAAAPAN